VNENIASVVRQMLEARLEQVHTFLPGKVVSFDATTLRAVVVPVLKKVVGPDETELEYLPIEATPVDILITDAFVIRPPYAEGDAVTLGFYERSKERILRDLDPRKPFFKRKHHLTDAIVIHGRMTDKEGESRPLPSVWTDELILYCRDSEATAIRLLPDKKIVIQVEPGQTIHLGPGALGATPNDVAVEGILLGVRTKTAYDEHRHTCPACGNPTSPPLVALPEPSQTVKVGE
jgi:hypothetical protein